MKEFLYKKQKSHFFLDPFTTGNIQLANKGDKIPRNTKTFYLFNYSVYVCVYKEHYCCTKFFRC